MRPSRTRRLASSGANRGQGRRRERYRARSRLRSALAGALGCAVVFACDLPDMEGERPHPGIDDGSAARGDPLRGRDLPSEASTRATAFAERDLEGVAHGGDHAPPSPGPDDSEAEDRPSAAAGALAEAPASGVVKPRARPEPPFELDPRQRRRIEAWFRRVGEVEPEESFGALVARAARVRLGTPYGALPEPEGEERLTVKVDRLDCLTLVESSNAVARCVWMGAAEAECFVDELRQTRYRGGEIDGYASRLHYFEDWMEDNARRARVRPLVRELGLVQRTADAAVAVGRRNFDFMTQHPRRYPALADPVLRDAIAAVEARISERVWPVLPKEQIPDILEQVEDGDIVGFVKGTPGLGVGHTGLVSIDRRGRPRILHATDRSGRVSLSTCDLASCEARRSDRVGIMIMRPLPPPRGDAPHEGDEGRPDRPPDGVVDDAIDLAAH